MSYLQYPRLIFSGMFQTDPSTVNNDPEHFDTSRFQPLYDMPSVGQSADEQNGWWNPKGRAAWRFRDCVVNQVEYTDGTVCINAQNDPVVGMPINSVVDRVEGKLVDLDPEQQMVSAIWGFQVFLGPKGNPIGFGGDYQVASFADIWARFPTGQPDSFFGAYYQSIIDLTSQILNGTGDQHSRFLEELQAAIGNGMQLSIKFNVDGYDDTSTSQTFTFGRVTGSIGAYYPGEPAQFVPGRVLLQQAGTTPGLNIAYGWVQGNVLHLDLGNSLPTTSVGGPLQYFGQLLVATQDSDGNDVVLGEVNYSTPSWYEQTAGIVSLPLTDAQLTLVNAQPLKLMQYSATQPATHFLAEASNGEFVRADQFVFRFNPTSTQGDTQSATFYATQFGKPLPHALISLQMDSSLMEGFIQQIPGGLPGPPVGTPTSIFSFPGSTALSPAGFQIKANGQGIATLSMIAADPGNPRGYIDGQVYGITYGLGTTPPAVGAVQNPNQILNLLVFNAYDIPAVPTWIKDVEPIFTQYAQLYPVMKRIVDLSNYGSVMQHRYILKNVFSVPMTDPNYMPVTRDLSAAKQAMILRWLDNPIYFDTGSVEQLQLALQAAIELEHSTIPAYLTAYYSIKPGANQEVANLIRSVVIEEMLHMSLVCNILISIGGSPSIGQPGFVPIYPGSLPGGVRTDLTVGLKRCTIEHVRDCFMSIEMPEEMLKERMRRLKPQLSRFAQAHSKMTGAAPQQEELYTIGWFYSQLSASLQQLSDAGLITFGNVQNQLSEWDGTGTMYVIQSLQDALDAITEITEQGEGTSNDPQDGDGELSHYYKFSEIVEGRQLVKTATGWAYVGAEIPFDPSGVHPMIDNPSLVNYPEGSRAALLSQEFNETYQALLLALNTTFNGNPGNIRASIGVMYSLGLIAAQLMETPSGVEEGKTAGPQFVTPN